MTPFDLAQRYVGEIHEVPGDGKSHPLVQWWLSLCGFGFEVEDEVAWCSAFANGIAWELRLPRSKSAAARSWLAVGLPVLLDDARPVGDVVVLQRGDGAQPGPDTLKAPGHVGLYAGREHQDDVLVLGGNQGNSVTIARFPKSKVLGIRRLAWSRS